VRRSPVGPRWGRHQYRSVIRAVRVKSRAGPLTLPTMAPTKQPVLERSVSPQEHYKRTVARLAKIQSHLATAPRTGKLRGKVAVVTGVGSLKGIGYASLVHKNLSHILNDFGRRAAALLFAHEGRHTLLLPAFWTIGVEISNHSRCTASLPHGPFRGEPPSFKVHHQGALSGRDSTSLAFFPSIPLY
jgi:hypothetical protein